MLEQPKTETFQLSDLETEGGKHLILSSISELYSVVGHKTSWGIENMNEEQLVGLLNKSGITKEELDFLVNTEIRTLDAKGIKQPIDFDKSPELITIRNKFAKILGGELIEA